MGGSFDVVIPAGLVKVTLPVRTNEDDIVEEDEYFKATLSLPGAPEGVLVGTPDTAYVTITDTTGMLGLECVQLLEFSSRILALVHTFAKL